MRHSDYVNKQMRTMLLIVLAVAALVGCSKPPTKNVGNQPVGGVDKPPTKEEIVAEAIDGANKRVEGHYDIEEPGKRWNAAVGSLVDLGEKMDIRARTTKNALCSAILTYDDPSVGALTATPQIRIQDAKNFEVEYSLPDSKGELNRVKGDGVRRAVLRDDGWSDLAAFSSKTKALTDKEVIEFPRRFPVEMFSQYTEDAEVWGSLFAAWDRGVGGYKAVFEEQTFKQGDSKAAHYRVYAKTTKDSPTTIEVIVDKKHLRPLTVKVEGTLKDGRKYNMYWTGSWQTGGTYDEGVFDIPKPQKKVAKAT